MLEQVAVVGPERHGPFDAAPSALRIIRHQPHHRDRTVAELHRRVHIAALFGVGDGAGVTLRELAIPAEEIERVACKDCDRGSPADAVIVNRAVQAGAVQDFERLLPLSAQEDADGQVAVEEASRWWGPFLFAEPLREVDELALESSLLAAKRGMLARLEHRRTHDLESVAHPTRQEQAPRGHARAEDHIRESEADGGGEGGIDPRAFQAWDGVRRTRLDSEPEERRQGQVHSMNDEPEHGAQHGRRRGKAHGGQDAVEPRGALDQLPAGQELLGGRAFKLRALQRRGAFGSREVGPGGLLTAPGPLEDGGDPRAQAARLFGRARSRLERHSQQAPGLVEGQLGDRFLGGPFGVVSGTRIVVGPHQVPGDRFQVGSL